MVQRGLHTLFADIFEEQQSPVSEKRKGRSASLNDRRNECLIDRYYWHGRLEIDGKRISYNSLITTLSIEFFLSTITIPEIIQANRDQLVALRDEWHKVDMPALQKHLQRKWPHMVWRIS